MQPYTPALLAPLYYTVTAALVLLPNTFTFRLFLLPFTLQNAARALQCFDIVELSGDARLNYFNYLFIGANILLMCMKTLDWTFRDAPLLRHKSSTNSTAGIRSFLKDVFDLCFNQRGIGWDWSRNYKPPSHTRPISSTARFVLYTIRSFIIHYIIADFAQYLAQSTDWTSFTNPHGAPLFNPRISPIPRYILSTLNSIMVGTILYCGIQLIYDFNTIISILFFGSSPVDWPPMFNEPWKSTSLVEFWGHRWHQIFRTSFVNLGNKPLAHVFGRKSGVGLFGGFLLSGLLHGLSMWRMNEKTDFILVGGYFIIQGVGVYFEVMVLDGKVGGWKGWIWTMVWVVVWSNMLAHGWVLHGFAASAFLPHGYRPSVMTFDFLRSLIF